MNCRPKQGVGAAWMLWVLLASGCGGGPSTREEAFAIVNDEVVEFLAYYWWLEIFATPEPLPKGTQIGVAFDDASMGPKTLATLTEPSWLFFVDLEPGARFEHPVKLVLVSREDGRLQSFNASWWPEVDGEDKWITREARELSGDRVYLRTPPAYPTEPLPGGGVSATVPAYCQPQNIQRWALTISAANDSAVDPGETDDLTLLLKSHGFTIQTLKPSTLRDGWATVQQELARIRTQMLEAPDQGYCDEFVLAWSGHGSRNGFLSIHDAAGKKTFISGQQLADAVDRTTEHIEGMQARTIIDACYSGQHLDTFEQVMPRNPNATNPNQIVRDVFVMTPVSAEQMAVGTTPFTDSFTVDTMDCIRDAGKVDFTTLFDCTRSDSIVRTPQARDWWNNGG